MEAHPPSVAETMLPLRSAPPPWAVRSPRPAVRHALAARPVAAQAFAGGGGATNASAWTGLSGVTPPDTPRGVSSQKFPPLPGFHARSYVLRQQIIVLRRGKLSRMPFSATDRLVLGWVCRLFPNARDALAIVRPETVMRWHRAGFRSYWRWKSRRRPGRPAVSAEIRQLIREMSIANPLWGAPRIHGELLKLGIDVGQTSVAKYMARRRGPPSQGWKTFLRNHADGIAAMDLFVVPTVSFRLLYGLLIMGQAVGGSCGLASRRIRRRSGWPTNSHRPAAGSGPLDT